VAATATDAAVGEAAATIPRETWRVAWLVAAAGFMAGLDASVVNVGLAPIAHALHAGLATAQWVATGYLLALGVSLPACGWLGRRVGFGRLWLGMLAAFTLASGLCALAPTIGWLIALRVAQGLAAGMLIPAAQTIIGQAVGAARLGRVMATLGVAVTTAPAIGPCVGGLVLHVAAWPWLFLLNVPLGLAALALGRRLVPRGEPGASGPLDWPGLLLVSAGLPLSIYGCTAWSEAGTLSAPAVLAPLAGGLAALAAYVLRATRISHALLDMRLFADPAYAAAAATAAFTGAALYGAALLYPLYFELGRGASVVATGASLLSLGLGTAVALPWSGRLVDRRGGGVVSLCGGLATVAATLPFALLALDADALLVQLLLLTRGMAIAFAAAPPVAAAFKAAPSAQLADAVTQVNILQRVGGALGGALFATVLARTLPQGAEHALHAAFGWLVGASAIGLATALWLTAAERRVTARAA